jgi:hypothetical protein
LYKKEIEIHKILSSPEHNYFTREKFDVGSSPTYEHTSIKITKAQGIAGDRFEFSKYPLTLFALEVANEVCNALEIDLDLKIFRRNIIVSGVNLNALIGKRFRLNGVEFQGVSHCAPCTWMNAVMKKGAFDLMRGRGGLRIEALSDGELQLGKGVLESEAEFDINPLTPLKRPKIPK